MELKGQGCGIITEVKRPLSTKTFWPPVYEVKLPSELMPGLLTFRSRQCGTQANNTNPVQLSFLGDFRRLCPLNNVQIRSTLVYQIDVQGKINVQVEKFLKNIKHAGQNKHAGGKFSG